jgi:hypothetical protein
MVSIVASGDEGQVERVGLQICAPTIPIEFWTLGRFT